MGRVRGQVEAIQSVEDKRKGDKVGGRRKREKDIEEDRELG